MALSVRSSRMRERRARAHGWSTTVSCTRDTVAGPRFPRRALHHVAPGDGATPAVCPRSRGHQWLAPRLGGEPALEIAVAHQYADDVAHVHALAVDVHGIGQ